MRNKGHQHARRTGVVVCSYNFTTALLICRSTGLSHYWTTALLRYWATALLRSLQLFLKTPEKLAHFDDEVLYASGIFSDISKFFGKLKEIFCLCQRTTGNIYETGEFLLGASAVAFDYVCRHGKDRPSYLTGNSEGFFRRERLSNFIDLDGKFVGLLPNNEVFVFWHGGNIACLRAVAQ